MYHLLHPSEGGHNWEKQNLITLSDNKGSYDLMKCKNCKMSARRQRLDQLLIDGRFSMESVKNCKGNKLGDFVGKKIKIIMCDAHGRQFKNLTPDSIHEIVTPPDKYKNDHSGVWVMGIGEPVKVLAREYKMIE